MPRKSNRWLTDLYEGDWDHESAAGRPIPQLRETLIPFADSVPWPVIVVENSGLVMYVNAAMHASGRKLPASGTRKFDKLFPEYYSALKGEPCWLTQQEAVVSRSISPILNIHERIWVRSLPIGACLIIMDETQLYHLESAHAQTARQIGRAHV